MADYNYFINLCKEKNLTLKDVYTEAQITPSVLYKWKNGICSPSHQTLQRLASYLKINIDQLKYKNYENMADSWVKFDKFLDSHALSIPKCAEILKIPRQTLYKWRDTGSMPSYITLQKISDTFGIDIEYFLDEKYTLEDALITKKLSELSTDKKKQILEFIKTL